jgi:NSS family neurotransmitter:Na+ symporter
MASIPVERGPVERGTAQWSSRFAFIMAAVGSSVGLGNLWRFSAELGTNGGAAFLIIYIACIVFVGIPVLMSEYIIGRAGNAASAVGSNNDLAKRSGVSKVWSSGAWFGMVASFLIVSFYCVVAAWVLAYIPKFILGEFSGMSAESITGVWDGIVGRGADAEKGITAIAPNPLSILGYFLLFAGITTWLVARGVNKGIELAAKLLMPLFFILLIGLALYSIGSSMESGGTVDALSFMFTPDFSAITPKIAQSALGQACFSIGIGNAIMITYGSYLPKEVSIPKSAVTVSVVDTLVAIVAGLMIFPIFFKNKLYTCTEKGLEMFGNNKELCFQAGEFEVASGTGLFFQSIPTALANVPGGMVIGAAFFFLAFFAAITSSVSLLEPSVAYLAEKTGWKKAKAAWVTGLAITVLGLGSLFISGFFDFIDTGLAGPILAPLSALLVVLFTGWRLNKAILAQELDGPGEALGRFIMIFVRYVAPIFMGLVLVLGTWEQWIAPIFAG